MIRFRINLYRLGGIKYVSKRGGHMKIFKPLGNNRNTVIKTLCLLALLFVCGCQCQGELGTKANKTAGSGVTSTALDNK